MPVIMAPSSGTGVWMPVAAIWRYSSSSVETSPSKLGLSCRPSGSPVGQSFACEMLALIWVSNWYMSSFSQRGRALTPRKGSPRKSSGSTYAWLRNQSTGHDVAEDESAAGGEVPVSDLELGGCEQLGNDVLQAAGWGSSYCGLDCELNVVASLAGILKGKSEVMLFSPTLRKRAGTR